MFKGGGWSPACKVCEREREEIGKRGLDVHIRIRRKA
jgi:hypothetical protein